MILPIIAYGHPVLREKAAEIDQAYPNLDTLVENMFETMYNAQGVGIAAPQIGLAIRLFIVDGSPMDGEDGEDLKDFKRVFINPKKVEETGEEWFFEEGCLSIPDIREDVSRPDTITITYKDLEFNDITETFTGLKARIVQHEYDHIEGILFTDYISPLRRQVIKPRLNRISKGAARSPYPMKYPKKKK